MVTSNNKLGNRILFWLCASGLLGVTAGCGYPHGSFQGDPMLGSFNRPIAATPPVFAGGDPGMGPGSDGGARLGMPSPDVPDSTGANGANRGTWLVPTYSFSGGLLNLRSGGSGVGGGLVPSEKPTMMASTGGGSARASANSGAKLLATDDSRKPMLASTNIAPTTDGTSVVFRSPEPNTMMMAGSAFVPPGPAKDRPVIGIYDRSRDPARISTVEEGQVILANYGIRWQRLEQAENGEWLFSCSKGANPNGTADRRYESRNVDQVSAVRNVIEQVKYDR
jgi:hypothetical protein